LPSSLIVSKALASTLIHQKIKEFGVNIGLRQRNDRCLWKSR